ncbi:MAG: DUF2325 domain-containing protein [Bacillota bacterium]
MVLIIGGDHLGSINQNLRGLGFDAIHHVKGRTEKRVEIPAGTDLIVVLIDYVNHNLARWVKEQAKARSLPIIFSRRSWSAICQSLQNCTSCPGHSRCPGSSPAG